MRIWHPPATINAALELVERGTPHEQAASAAGVSVHTLRTWLYQGAPARARYAHRSVARCGACGGPEHEFGALDPATYAYMLGMYLGDGTIYGAGKGVYVLRVTLDAAYPAIVAECRSAMGRLRDGRGAHVACDSSGKRCLHVTAYWKQWPCHFPQHGPGRKHTRPIVLEPWQRAHVEAAPEMFLRALIQTDGWRGTNNVTAKGRVYAYPRYQFSNRSDDIRGLFTDACDRLGIAWRPWGRWHVSVAKRAAVARMDEFVGPKA